MTPASHVVDLILEECQSHIASPIVEEIPPSTLVTSPSSHNPSVRIASTSTTILDTIPSRTLLGTDMDIEVEFVFHSITIVSSAEVASTYILSFLLE